VFGASVMFTVILVLCKVWFPYFGPKRKGTGSCWISTFPSHVFFFL